ncbi:MAG: hypothetical protein AB1700_04135 [Bacillota bacterium]
MPAEVLVKVKDLGLDEFITKLYRSTAAIEKLLNQQSYRRRFRDLWEADADQYEFYKLADEIHRKAFGSPLSLSEWDRAWQWRVVLHPDYKQAKVEFVNAVLGWF